MKIVMKTKGRNPAGGHEIGDVRDVPEKEAVKLVESGCARYAKDADVTKDEKPKSKNSAADNKKQEALAARGNELNEREVVLGTKETYVGEQKTALDEREVELDERELALDERTEVVESAEKELAEKAKDASPVDETTSKSTPEDAATRKGKPKK